MVHEDVLQLQVAVDDVLLVEVVQCRQQLRGIESRTFLGEASTELR
jgi:predicted RNA-binding protein